MATTNTISGLLARISNSANTIWNKAALMNLSLPAGSYWDLKNKADKTIYGNANKITGTDSPEAEYIIDASNNKETFNFGIDAVAAAIGAMNVRDYLALKTNSSGAYLTKDTIATDTKLNANLSIYIPVGYNKTPFTITANSLSGQTQGTALAKHIYTGKTAWVNGTQLTGTLANVYLYYKSLSNKNYDLNKLGANNFLKVSINANNGDTYSTSEMLQTNIPYRFTLATNGNKTIGSTTSQGSPGTAANITIGSYEVYSGGTTGNYTKLKFLLLSPTEGYYDSVWETNIKFDPYVNTNLEITKSTNADGTDTIAVGTVQIPAGYYSQAITISPVVHWDGTTADRILNYFTGKLTPSLNTKTGTLSNFLGKNSDGTLKKFDYIDPASIYEITTGSVKVTKTINANNSITFSKTVTSGWVDSDNVTLDNLTIAAATHNLTTHSDSKFGGSSAIEASNITSITTQYFKDAITAGYIPNSTKYYKIKDGSHAVTSISKTDLGENSTTEITTLFVKDERKEGWIPSGTNYFKVLDFTVIATTGSNYKKVNKAGWIYTVDNSGNPYYVTSTVYSGSKTNTVEIGNGQKLYTISGGTYLPEDVEFTFNSGKGQDGRINYDTIKDQIWNANGSDYEYTLGLSTGFTYWKEMKLDMSVLLLELLKI